MRVKHSMKPVLCLLAALVPAVFLGGCATKTDLESVQNQAYRDRQESRKTIQRLEEDLAKSQEALRDEIQKSTSPVQARQANTWAELESMRVQVAKLNEKLDTLTMRFNTLTSSQAGGPSITDMAKDLQNIKTALSSQFGLDVDSGAAPAPQAEAAPAPDKGKAKADDKGKKPEAKTAGKPEPKEDAPKAEADKSGTAEALFAKADAAFKAKKYEESRQYYSEFVTTFKKHPNTSSAIFWVGESAYNLQDYGKAVLAYQEVIEKYKSSPKYKAAILKQGMAFYKIGKDKAGRAVLEDLISRFPKDPEATRAKQFLKEQK